MADIVPDINVYNQTLANAFCLAAYQNNVEALNVAYKLSPEGSDMQNMKGGLHHLSRNSAIHFPCLFCDLLQHQPTPLMIACYMGSLECTSSLIERPNTVLSGFVHFTKIVRAAPFWDIRRYQCIRLVANALWMRAFPKILRIGRIALFVRMLFEEVHYRPDNNGARACRQEFEHLSFRSSEYFAYTNLIF